MIRLLLVALIFCVSCFGYSQQDTLFCKQVSALNSTIETNHFAPKPLNDSTSISIYKLFLKEMDAEKDYFLKSDITSFNRDEFKFDDYIKKKQCLFIDKYISVLEQKIKLNISKLEALKQKPLNYSGTITLQRTPKKFYSYFENETALDKGLRKRIGYLTIVKLIDDNADITSIKKNFKTLEKEAKQLVIENEICLLNEFLNKDGGIDRFVKESFLNAYVKVNDPNSTFFNSTEKLTYQNRLSKNQMSFGIITTKNNNGEIAISHIVPGSAAFENGKFEEDDVLQSISNGKSVFTIHCISNADIQLYLNKEEHKTLSFSIKKKNGTLQDIKLTKSNIKVENNAIRGYLIRDASNYGYIKIPSFYTNYESPNGRGLTADLAKELYKLQKQNIEGLILDLRFNGGGSMQEAIELSGMFIDRGPVAIIKSKAGENFTVKDRKRGSFYSKPIVILLNDYSASASEFFAAAMQDYNRALIVGSTTYGKSSAQTILPLDEDKTLGFTKLTIEAFYRVTGKSHQAIGIIPDIKLPSMYDNFKTAESDKAHALQNDSTQVTLKHLSLKKLGIANINAKSVARVLKDENFKRVLDINTAFYALVYKKGTKYKLTLESISAEQKRRQETLGFIFDTDDNFPLLLKMTNTKSTNEILEYNTEDKEQNTAVLKSLAQDIYINEAQHILKDLITQN
ncbi:carboxy terminal-processing peptidase [Lacinutrix jangbogonensis]|uniref:carboxy terminal-processing peptidase n=1 Tax=Lacinutrix jangbogonensis TaxID=1469557 RepID=UPI00053E801C|nr:carboxy terminal-processing peptidase [Lacinutrix jangbogonensis]